MNLDKTTARPEQEKQENQASEAETPSCTFDVGLQIAREARSISKYRLLSAILDKAKTALEALAVWREAPDKSQLQESTLTRAENLFQEKPPTTVLEALAVWREAPDKSQLQESTLTRAEKLFRENPPTTVLEALRVRSITPDKSQLQDSALELAEQLFWENPPQTALEALEVRHQAPRKSSLKSNAFDRAKELLTGNPPNTALGFLKLNKYLQNEPFIIIDNFTRVEELFEKHPPQSFPEAQEIFKEILSCRKFLKMERGEPMLLRMISLANHANMISVYFTLELERNVLGIFRHDRETNKALNEMERRFTRQSIAGAVKDEQAV